MRTINLVKVPHAYKVNDAPKETPPSFTGDALFVEDGKPVGFFIEKVPEKLQKIVDVANAELLSDRVPKTVMMRKHRTGRKLPDGKWEYRIVEQYSCSLGSIAPNIIMRCPYPNRSSVHRVGKARPFVKAMLAAGYEALTIMESVSPELYAQHREAVLQNVPEKWRFAGLFSSSISNCNIAAPIHQDNANVRGSLNVIITKRLNARGGNLFVPDYDTTFNSVNNSMLVYPAWRNLHGVTPIVPTHQGGYRNSLVWYSLKGMG